MKTIQDNERRSFERLKKHANGQFFINETVNHGSIEVINYSRNGIRANIDHHIDLDTHLYCKLQFPERAVPIFPTGRVVWLSENTKGSKYRYNIGIYLDDHNTLEEEKTISDSCASWYLEKVADYAFHCGLLSRHSRNDALKISAYLPALFIGYFLVGALFSYNNPIVSLFFSASIGLIIIGILIKSRKGLTLNQEANQSRRIFLKHFAYNCAGILLIHICYGIFFIAGYLSKNSAHRKILSVGR